jgi:tetratricopeptide (TPR) repeat protein
MKMGDSAQARRYLAAGIDAPDASPEFIYNYAVSLIQQKQFEEAIAPLQRVVAQKPDMSQAWQALALSLRMGQHYDQAVEAYRKALAFGPDPKLQFNLALCLSRQGKTAAAIEAYRQALSLDPGFLEAYYNLSRTLIVAERYEEALVVLQQHLEREPGSYRIYLNQGLCYFHLGRYDEAIQKYELALEQQETADAYNNLGLVYNKLGEKEEANYCFQEAKKLQRGRK